MFYSPLRYPGGKNKLAKFIAKICIDNDMNNHYVEPYAGGAAVSLYLLMENKVSKITINDFDRSIYAFWYSVLKSTKKFCNLIEETDITIENWQKAREIQKNKKKATLLELGFSTFFLNRTNMSGIINAGVIGGIEQKGKYRINCRFNKRSLISRIKKIAEHKKNITIYNLNAIELIKKIQKKESHSQTIFYFDPPYYLKGSSLYVNYYNHADHKEIAKMIKKIKKSKWIISYDNTSQIQKIYSWVNKKIEYSVSHTAREAKAGKEILFFSKNLKIQKGINPITMTY
ncbi:DNA adenine methylase [Candidatus Parcubacteria bacterium]|nr:DNA adenine methylase [Candidatus Parcubacteria bacterium]